MTLPYQEHNSLLATREFLNTLLDEEKTPEIPTKIRLSAKSLLKYYPTTSKLNDLYEGNTVESLSSSEKSIDENSNKVINDNQTWETPGFKWKTEVEFISKNEN